MTSDLNLLKDALDGLVENGERIKTRHTRHIADAKEELSEEEFAELVEYGKGRGLDVEQAARLGDEPIEYFLGL